MKKRNTSQRALTKVLCVLTLITILSFSTTLQAFAVVRLRLTDTAVKANKVYSHVDDAPEFPGGTAQFEKFINQNIKYPVADAQNKVEGFVLVSFIVEKNGMLTTVKALRGPSPAINDEAVRVVKLSPMWKPGLENGKPVRVSYISQIAFHLKKTNQASASLTKKDAIYAMVAEPPHFTGGPDKFREFLNKNLKFPDEMLNKKIEGTVVVQFIVEKDGALSEIKAIRGPGAGSSEEAVRIMQLSPKWEPGYQNGEAVRVMMTTKVTFTLPR